MSLIIESYCGLVCSKCEFVESAGCKGCCASQGKPFYGVCEVAECCKKRETRFCGECKDFPCEIITRYSFDKEHDGDNGERIETCKAQKATLVSEAREGIDHVSYCGHHCDYCFLAKSCGGCRSGYNCCSLALASEDKICPNVKCCNEKNIDGCYECGELEYCEKGYYSDKNEYIARAAAIFIKKYGKEEYINALGKAVAAGIEYSKSFDEAGSVEAAVALFEKYK